MLVFSAFGCEQLKTFNLHSYSFPLFLCWENQHVQRWRERLCLCTDRKWSEIRTFTLSTEVLWAGTDSHDQWEVERVERKGRWGGKWQCIIQRVEGEMGGLGEKSGEKKLTGEWWKKCSMKKKEGERSMALWKGRGRGTVHSKVWLHSRLSGSDSDGLLFFFFFFSYLQTG